MNLARQPSSDFDGIALAEPGRSRPRLDLLRGGATEAERPTGRAGLPMVTLDREGFLDLRRVLPAATKDCLRDTFGVSETTWVKLRDGRPVKKVTLERLLVRYRKIVEGARRAGERDERGTPMASPRQPTLR